MHKLGLSWHHGSSISLSRVQRDNNIILNEYLPREDVQGKSTGCKRLGEQVVNSVWGALWTKKWRDFTSLFLKVAFNRISEKIFQGQIYPAFNCPSYIVTAQSGPVAIHVLCVSAYWCAHMHMSSWTHTVIHTEQFLLWVSYPWSGRSNHFKGHLYWERIYLQTAQIWKLYFNPLSYQEKEYVHHDPNSLVSFLSQNPSLNASDFSHCRLCCLF